MLFPALHCYVLKLVWSFFVASLFCHDAQVWNSGLFDHFYDPDYAKERAKKFGVPDDPGPSESSLPPVRSDQARYFAGYDPKLTQATADYLFKLNRNTYGRATVGLIERMFGGVSGEILVDGKLFNQDELAEKIAVQFKTKEPPVSG